MKNTILSLFIILLLTACNQKAVTTESTTTTEVQEKDTTTAIADTIDYDKPKAELYSCPMHPEVKGPKGSKCPKCGMALTEPVKQK